MSGTSNIGSVAAIVADMKQVREIWISEGINLSDPIGYVEEWVSRLSAITDSRPTPTNPESYLHHG